MRKRHLFLPLLVIIAALLVAIPVFAAVYNATYTITSTSATAYSMIGVSANASNLWMSQNGFMKTTALDTRVKTAGGVEKSHMVTDNATFTAVPVGAYSQTNLYYSMGNSDLASMAIIPGYNGYFTVADNASLELSNNSSVSETGYFDTTQVGESLFSKRGAIKAYISASGTVTACLSDNYTLAFTRTNSDYVSIPDSDNFSFTSGVGVDLPFSITGWVKLIDATASTIVSKQLVAGNLVEWVFQTNASDNLSLFLGKNDASAYLWASGGSMTTYQGSWAHVAATYDGSKTYAGIKLYINGSQVSTADISAGTYTGMTNTIQPVELGRSNAADFMSGTESNIKIYNTVLTPAEVLAAYNGAGKLTNLVAWYKLSDGAGNPADSSGNGHNATGNLADWTAEPSQDIWGAITTSVTPVAPGPQNITATLDPAAGGSLYLTAAGVTTGVGLGGTTVPNNLNDWTFMSNATPYMTFVQVTVNGTLRAYYQPVSMIIGTNLPDRALGDGVSNNGTFVWGTNPAGIAVSLGSLVSASQPSPGATTERETRDILPATGASDWFREPDVSDRLLTNPLRPLVTILSTNTSLTERQAWIWLGLAFVLFVLLITAKSVRGHHIITGIATGAAMGACVAMTIFPLWALVFVIAAIAVGTVAERSPSL